MKISSEIDNDYYNKIIPSNNVDRRCNTNLITIPNEKIFNIPYIRAAFFDEITPDFSSNCFTLESSTSSLLEVVDKNMRAQKLYENLGFKFTRVLKCYKLTDQIKVSNNTDLTIKPGEWNDSLINNLSFEPCFMDSTNQLHYNLKHEKVLIAKIDNQPVGHLVFQPDLGRISQLAVHSDHRKKGIGKQLVSACHQYTHAAELTILNIPESELDSTSLGLAW